MPFSFKTTTGVSRQLLLLRRRQNAAAVTRNITNNLRWLGSCDDFEWRKRSYYCKSADNRGNNKKYYSRSYSSSPSCLDKEQIIITSSPKQDTSAWLAAGGDGRVTLHDDTATASFKEDDDVGYGRGDVIAMGINAYGTSTHPRPEVIERSSCTSSSPRIQAFEHVSQVRDSISSLDLNHLQVQPSIDENSSSSTSKGEHQWPDEATPAVSELVASNRSRLLKVLGLEPYDGTSSDDQTNSAACIMCASGTDAELIGALAGISAAGIDSDTVKKWTSLNSSKGKAVSKDGASLVSILMPGTGSGVGDAAGMRHHSAAAPQADSVQPGEPLQGMVDGSIVAYEPVRENIDVTNVEDLREYIQAKQEQTRAGSVLLHAIAGSKTGMHQPPLVVVDALAAASNNILVCVDACQLRVTPEYIQSQLEKGYIVLLTGSKFYGGPPFSGACLLPPQRASELEALAALEGGIPTGLAEYFTADDVPAECMPLLKSKFPTVPNTGLALRWTAALHTMERFHQHPPELTGRVAKRWVSRIRALAEGFYPAVEVLEVHGIDAEEEYRIGNINTVVSFMIRTTSGSGGGGMLGVKGLKQLQLLLGSDLSEFCDGTCFPESARGIAQIRAQLGQPVLLGGGARHGVVRLAIGAIDICEVVEAVTQAIKGGDSQDPFVLLDAMSDAIDAMIVQDVQVLRKIELLATNWEAVAKRFDDLPATAVRWQARLAAEGVQIAPAASGKEREVTHVDINWLKPHEMVVNQDRVTALVDAIGRWGAYRKPLLVDRESGSILDGHHRYFAAQKLGLARVPAALVDYLDDDSISVELWPGDHGVTSISKQDVIDMCLSADVFPPKTSRHTFAEPLDPIFVPLEELRDEEEN